MDLPFSTWPKEVAGKKADMNQKKFKLKYRGAQADAKNMLYHPSFHQKVKDCLSPAISYIEKTNPVAIGTAEETNVVVLRATLLY